MSKLTQKKEELKQKETLILSDLSEKATKKKKVIYWSIGVGVISLLGYALYQSFSDSEPRKPRKKNKPRPPRDNDFVDSAIEQVAPKIGDWLLKKLK